MVTGRCKPCPGSSPSSGGNAASSAAPANTNGTHANDAHATTTYFFFTTLPRKWDGYPPRAAIAGGTDAARKPGHKVASCPSVSTTANPDAMYVPATRSISKLVTIQRFNAIARKEPTAEAAAAINRASV